DFEVSTDSYNVTTIFKNSFIARYVKITKPNCNGACEMAFHVLGCEWSPVCLDHLELSNGLTEANCYYPTCAADVGSIRTVTGITTRLDNSAVPSFKIRHSVDGESYRDLIDRSGVVV
ncbi:uncharacterized protein LOC117120663, partial [Anneissia japonica]|uniref:uncharacterized protein LOC117120663 n=1 Tax=Anneissia japonica TaxID=1529436 RepID=UPI0014256234